MLQFLRRCKFIRKFQPMVHIAMRYYDPSIHNTNCQSLLNLQSLKYLCSGSSFSSLDGDISSFTIAYLKNSCGLSGKSLTFASERVSFESSVKPNSVLEFFRSAGFSQSQVSAIISLYPPVLAANPEKTLKPKIDFFLSVGLSEADVCLLITRDPAILTRSVKDHLVPSFDFLKTLVGSEQKAQELIKRRPAILSRDACEGWQRNVLMLKSIGVPEFQISKVIAWHPHFLGQGLERLSAVAMRVKEIGFDPSSVFFLVTINGMLGLSESTWEKKFQTYRSLGFSEHEINNMFKLCPQCMFSSMETIKRKLEFYIKNFHWSPSKVSTRPYILRYSLEKRLIPRCSVMQVLWLKNVNTGIRLTSLIQMSEKKFLQQFVCKHEEEVPEVWAAYQGRLRFEEFNFVSR